MPVFEVHETTDAARFASWPWRTIRVWVSVVAVTVTLVAIGLRWPNQLSGIAESATTIFPPGGAGPGATLTGQAGPLSFKVVVQSPNWIEATTLETIVDGKTVNTQLLQEAMGSGTPRRYEALVDVMPTEVRTRHHVIFHASSPGKDLSPIHPGRHTFAVSNPIFF